MAQNNAMVKKGRCLNFGNCNKANTKEIIDINVGEDFVCPECEGELVEVKVTDTPWILIIGGAVAVLAIAVVTFIFFNQDGGTEPLGGGAGGNITVVDSIAVDTLMQSGADIDTDTKQITEVEVVQPAGTVTETTQTSKESSAGGVVTKDLGYAVWTGKVKNGRPHDVQGTLTFKASHIIDSRDEKGRTAGPGDRVIGTFEDGHLTQGKWYKSDGNVESIILGGV